MAPSPDNLDQTLSATGSPRARDRGLRRSRRLTGWIVAAAVAGTAVLGGFYTHLLPGSSISPATVSPPVRDPAPSFSTVTAAEGGEHGERGERNDHEDDEDDDEGAVATTRPLQPPAQPPAATQQRPHTTTGAS